MSAFRIARGAARIAIAASCLAIIAASRLFAAPGGGLDNAPPYNWRLPKPVRVEVVLKEAK